MAKRADLCLRWGWGGVHPLAAFFPIVDMQNMLAHWKGMNFEVPLNCFCLLLLMHPTMGPCWGSIAQALLTRDTALLAVPQLVLCKLGCIDPEFSPAALAEPHCVPPATHQSSPCVCINWLEYPLLQVRLAVSHKPSSHADTLDYWSIQHAQCPDIGQLDPCLSCCQ